MVKEIWIAKIKEIRSCERTDHIPLVYPGRCEGATAPMGLRQKQSNWPVLGQYPAYMKPKLQFKPPRKIFNFQRADVEDLKPKVEAFSQEFLSSNPSANTVDTNWATIRNNLHEIVKQCSLEIEPREKTPALDHT